MRPRNGYSLISVLVAVVLLSIALMSLAGMGTRVVSTQTNAGYRGTAVSIARGYLEQIRSRDPSGIVNEPVQAVNAEGQPTVGGPYTRQVIVNDVRTNVRRVRVLVGMPRGSQPVELTTLIFIGVT